jgi:hypothetical protein
VSEDDRGPRLFSSPEFLGTVASVIAPGQSWAVEEVNCAGSRYAVLVVDGSRVIDLVAPLSFYYEPLGPAQPELRTVPSLFRVVTGTVSAGEYARVGGTRAAPFINFRQFPAFEDFLAFRPAQGAPVKNWYSDMARRRRRLVEALGEPEFFFHEEVDGDTVASLMRGKAAELASRGVVTMLDRPRAIRLYTELARRGIFRLSGLQVGGRLVASILGSAWNGSYSGRLTHFEPDLRPFSPGTLLLHEVLHRTYAAGFAEFDFLYGDEAYKFHYATHVRVVATAGRPPPQVRLARWWSSRRRRS